MLCYNLVILDRFMEAFGNQLRDDAGNGLGTFSSHWAACAAMIRLSDPTFVSLGGDKAEDLAVEERIRNDRN
jgi:hypothetical protein